MIEILSSDVYVAVTITAIGFVVTFFATYGGCRIARWHRPTPSSQREIRKLRASVASVPAPLDARGKAVAGGANPPAAAPSCWPAAERRSNRTVRGQHPPVTGDSDTSLVTGPKRWAVAPVVHPRATISTAQPDSRQRSRAGGLGTPVAGTTPDGPVTGPQSGSPLTPAAPLFADREHRGDPGQPHRADTGGGRGCTRQVGAAVGAAPAAVAVT